MTDERADIIFDAYTGWSEDQLKRRCRELLRENAELARDLKLALGYAERDQAEIARLKAMARRYQEGYVSGHKKGSRECQEEINRLRAENDMMRSRLIDAPTKEERDL